MNYTLKLDAAALQVIGEALAIAPMAMRVTQPVLAGIQQQIGEQEAAARAPNPPQEPDAPATE